LNRRLGLPVVLGVALLTLVCGRSRAGTPAETMFFQDIPTVITPGRVPQKPWRAPSSCEVVTAESIRRWGCRSVADVLRRLAGVDVRKAGWQTEIGPRGTTSTKCVSHVLVLLDGIPVLDPLLGRFDLCVNFPVDLIEQVEVVRGTGSSLYGANAFSGVINIITKTASDRPDGELRQEIGSYRTTRTNLTLSHPSQQTEWLLGLRGFFTDARDAHAVNDNDGLNDRDAFANVSRGRGRVMAYTSRLSQGRPLNEQDADPVDYVENDDTYLRASYRLVERPGMGLVVDVYANRQDGTYPGGGVPGRPDRVVFDTDRQGTKLELTRDLGRRRTLVGGIEYARKAAS